MSNASRASFSIDLSPLIRQYQQTPSAIAKGARSGMQDALNDWQAEARDDAPFEYGELKRQIEQELKGSGLNVEGIISNNVYNNGFNYAYWQHNVRGGQGLKYIDNVAERNQDKWLDWIKDEIKAELKKAGW